MKIKEENFRKIIFSLIALTIMVLAILSFSEPKNQNNLSEINNSINKGILFLYSDQLNNGEFKAYVCGDDSLNECSYDSSNFVTSLTLYSIKDIKNKEVQNITLKGLNFLLSDQEYPGLWNYWSENNSNHNFVPPDSEDTSVASFILRMYNKSFQDNLQVLEQNKNNESLYYTWLNNSESGNNIDCVINANVVMYTKSNENSVCAYLKKVISSNQNCSLYYPNRFVLYYTVSKAFSNNISCLGENRNEIIKKILANQQPNGSFGSPLNTALAINTLINYDYHGKEVDRAVTYLISTQNRDGHWSKEIYFEYLPSWASYYYGSEDLSTAISIEALNKYLSSI